MKTVHILIALVLLGAPAGVPAVAQVVVPSAAHQWEVHNADGVSYGTDYELHNQKNNSQLGYEGALGWVGHSGGYFNFMRWAPDGTRDHRTGPIPENADVAIYNTKSRRYLTYKTFDNNQAELDWTTTLSYEWQLHDQQGTSVASFALFNSRVKKYLVLQNKDRGINLGWLNDTPSGPQSFSVKLVVLPRTQGLVPYRGSFGQNMRGNLLTVRNASPNATLLFLKTGQSPNDCSVPNATVRVAPRATLTADQMKTLYGSATPRLPITFMGCLATTTTTQTITSLNITYKLDP